MSTAQTNRHGSQRNPPGRNNGEEQEYGNTIGADASVARGIRSICHDVIRADRELDYLALGMFLPPTIWKYLACEVVAVDIQPEVGAGLRTYAARPTANESMISLIAHQGRMIWGKPTAATSRANWRGWETNAREWGWEVIRAAVPWKQRLRADTSNASTEAPSVPKQRHHCGLEVEGGLTLLSVVTAQER